MHVALPGLCGVAREGGSYIDVPQVLEDVHLCHKAQLFFVALPRDELDSDRCRAMKHALVNLQHRNADVSSK